MLLLVITLYLRNACFLEIRQGIPSKTLGYVGKDGLS